VRPLLCPPLSLLSSFYLSLLFLPRSSLILCSPPTSLTRRSRPARADHLAVESKKDAPKGLQRTNSEMEMIAEKAALLSTHEEDEIPRLTSDQLSPMEEREGLSIITPGENHTDPLSTATSNKMSEKARGKMRAVDTSNEEEVIDIADEELLGIAAAGVGPSGYVPTQEWVSSWQKGYVFFLLHSFFFSSFVLFPSHVISTIHDRSRFQSHLLLMYPSLYPLLASRLDYRRTSLTLQPPPRPSSRSDIRAPPQNPRYPTPNRCPLFENLQPPKRFNNIRITLRTPPPFSGGTI
jgi:hypothetical protein